MAARDMAAPILEQEWGLSQSANENSNFREARRFTSLYSSSVEFWSKFQHHNSGGSNDH
jgi:hypothetical protein